MTVATMKNWAQKIRTGRDNSGDLNVMLIQLM
jgi:hypothetical protein